MCRHSEWRHAQGVTEARPALADKHRGSRGIRLLPWQAVAQRAARQAQVISVAQLRACGISPDGIDRATRAGHLHVIHRGVRAVGTARLTPDGRLWAAVLAVGKGAGIVNDTAAALDGFRPLEGPIHIAAPQQRRAHRGVVVHCIPGLQPAWIHRRHGLPVLRPAHALLDIAAVLDEDALAIALNEALALPVVRLAELDAVLEARPGHHGRGRLAAAVAEVRDDPGAGRTHSELEDLVLLLLRGMPGLPPFQRNQFLKLGGGRTAKADVLFPGPGVMLELDSRKWHRQKRAMDSDRRRDQQALAVGIITFRITWRHATQEWPAVSADLVATLRSRRG